MIQRHPETVGGTGLLREHPGVLRRGVRGVSAEARTGCAQHRLRASGARARRRPSPAAFHPLSAHLPQLPHRRVTHRLSTDRSALRCTRATTAALSAGHSRRRRGRRRGAAARLRSAGAGALDRVASGRGRELTLVIEIRKLAASRDGALRRVDVAFDFTVLDAGDRSLLRGHGEAGKDLEGPPIDDGELDELHRAACAVALDDFLASETNIALVNEVMASH